MYQQGNDMSVHPQGGQPPPYPGGNPAYPPPPPTGYYENTPPQVYPSPQGYNISIFIVPQQQQPYPGYGAPPPQGYGVPPAGYGGPPPHQQQPYPGYGAYGQPGYGHPRAHGPPQQVENEMKEDSKSPKSSSASDNGVATCLFALCKVAICCCLLLA